MISFVCRKALPTKPILLELSQGEIWMDIEVGVHMDLKTAERLLHELKEAIKKASE